MKLYGYLRQWLEMGNDVLSLLQKEKIFLLLLFAVCKLKYHWNLNFGSFLTLAADRTRMPLNHAEMITVGTHVCK